MKTMKSVLFFVLGTLLYFGCSNDDGTRISDEDAGIPHLQKQGTATRMVVDGKPFLMVGGQLYNSSSMGFAYMRPIWKRMVEYNLNTVIAASSWELVEPEEDVFDFALVDSAILGARKEGLKLAIIWFASWKNGGSGHTPPWIKLDRERFPLAEGESGDMRNALSTFYEENCNADAKAFSALMKHIKEIDGEHHTVLMMQVENEMGLTGTKRDFSEVANQAFNGPVPSELMDYIVENKATLHPGVLEAWEKQGFRQNGTWEEVFGKGVLKDDWKDLSYLTEELFMAWHYAKYVGKVATAGKAEYNIPMYVNAWIKQPGRSGHAPGNYPCGGPTPHVFEVWRAGAPAIDFFGPDLYTVDEFRYTTEQYTRAGNPLFMPETIGYAARAFYAYGKHSAMGYCPFGVNGKEEGPDYLDMSDFQDVYRIIRQMEPVILEYQGTENISGLLADKSTLMDSVMIGGYMFKGSAYKERQDWASLGLPMDAINAEPPSYDIGGAMIICIGPGEFYLAGKNMNISIPGAGELGLEDGEFVDGQWVTGRHLNGDEGRISFRPDKSKIYKVRLYKL